MKGKARKMKHSEMLFPNFSYYLVTGNHKPKLGACEEELFHLELE